MDIASRLGLNAYRTGGGDQERPSVGVNIGHYTPQFMAGASFQSGSPNVAAYAQYDLASDFGLPDNIDLGVGGFAYADKNFNFSTPEANISYNSFENNSGFSAGARLAPDMPPQYFVQYQRRF